MSDEEKNTSSKWVKVLDAAGLLDDIEDGWSLPPGRPIGDATIKVSGEGGITIPPDEPALPHEEPGIDERVSGVPPIILEDPKESPEKPLRRKTSSTPASGGGRAPVSDSPQQHSGQYIAIASAKETALGLPIMSGRSSVSAGEEKPWNDYPSLESEGESGRGEPHDRGARFTRERVSMSEARRITVVPESSGNSPPPSAIIDEPTIEESRPFLKQDKVPAGEGSPRELFEVGDFTGALGSAEEILKSDPGNFEAARIREEARDTLMRMYESRIGQFDRVPQIAVTNHELIWRDLDSQTGFILSRIDGFGTFEDILDISGLPRFDTCRILDRLLQDGIIV